MLSHKLKNSLLHTLTAGNNDQKILAAAALVYVPEAKKLLQSALYSEEPDLIIAGCEALKKHTDIDHSLISRLVNEHPDTDVRLAALSLLNESAQSEEYLQLLVTLLSEEDESWIDEWNSSFDIQLAAASSLLSVITRLSARSPLTRPLSTPVLSKMDIEGVINRVLDDPEPELSQVLYYIIAQVKPEWLVTHFHDANKTHRRQIAKATQDKVALYRWSRDKDVVIRRHAVKALAQMNAKEYLQDFLAWLSDEDGEIFRSAATCLAQWDYQVDNRYLAPALSGQKEKLDCIEPFVDNSGYQILLKQWQDKSIAEHNIALFFRLSLKHNHDVKAITKAFYQRFAVLSVATQIEVLRVIVEHSSTFELSLAFIRQVLQVDNVDNSVRRIVIEYLIQQKAVEYIAYLKQLYFEDKKDIAISITEQQHELTPSSDTTEQSVPISTFEALLKPSPSAMATTTTSTSETENPLPEELSHFQPLIERQQNAFSNNSRRKVARINSVSNKQLAQELYLDSDWIQLAIVQQPSIELLKACQKANIYYDAVKSESLDQWLLMTLQSLESLSVSVIVNWMGPSLPEPFVDTLLNSSNPNALLSVIDRCRDDTTLIRLLDNPYIDIKQKAYQQLLTLNCEDKEAEIQLLTFAFCHEELIELVPDWLISNHEELLTCEINNCNDKALILARQYLASTTEY